MLGLLRALVTEQGQTVIMVTHDPMAAACADRVVFLADGRIADSLDCPTAEAVAARMTRLEVSSRTATAALAGHAGDAGRADSGTGMLTVALATVRTRWVAFAGTFAALALGVSVIATMTLVLAAASGGGGHQSPERFAAAPFVIQADPALRVRDGTASSIQCRCCSSRTCPRPPSPNCQRAPRPQLLRPARGVPATQPARRPRLVERSLRPLRLTSGHPPRTDGQIVVAGRAALGSPVSCSRQRAAAFTIVWHRAAADR